MQLRASTLKYITDNFMSSDGAAIMYHGDDSKHKGMGSLMVQCVTLNQQMYSLFNITDSEWKYRKPHQPDPSSVF